MGMRTRMSEQKQQEELTPEEFEEQNGELLPDREAMSTIEFGPGPMALDPTLPVEPPSADPDAGHTLPIEPPATE
jgi:hypothetical protein